MTSIFQGGLIPWRTLCLGFEAFLHLFNTTLDAPIKELTKKEEKDKLKPWVTRGIKKSMSVRDKIYKQMIKGKDQLIKTEKCKKN